MIAIVDTGPLYAAVDSFDMDHERCLSVLERADLHLVVPTMVVAETTQLIERRLGPQVEATFLRGIADIDVEAPSKDDWHRIADLVDKYSDFPLGGTDASVVALAERLDTPLVVTLDHRHFRAVRPKHRPAFEVIPAL